MKHVLVVAYGNPLRSDDGIAWQAGEVLRRYLPHTSKVICVQQLTPELAEDVALADQVVFLDASRDGEPGSVRSDAVFAQAGQRHFSHHLSPAEVLGLCDQLYSAKPHAFIISGNGQCFDHGKELSELAVHAVQEVVAEVSRLIKHLKQESRTFDPFMATSQTRAL